MNDKTKVTITTGGADATELVRILVQNGYTLQVDKGDDLPFADAEYTVTFWREL